MKFTVQEPGPLLDLLCGKLHPETRTSIRKLLKQGGVLLDGEIAVRADQSVSRGQTLEIRRGRIAIAAAHAKSPFPILFEDPHVIAVLKPAGILSVATDREKTHTLYKSVREYVKTKSAGKEKIFIVHRLDREVSGIVLLAKSIQAQNSLQRGWGGAEKLYCALVEGHPQQTSGTIRSWLRENRAHNVYSCPEGPEARLAVTHYRQLKKLPRHTLLEVRLETGRKHQIRVHLSEMGCPIVGDTRYGAHASATHRFGLCAHSLAFDHPITRKRVHLSIPVPKALQEFRGPR